MPSLPSCKIAAPLTAPSEPLDLTSSLVNSTSFYLQWSIPASSGGIAIRNYTVQLYDLGNALGCNPSQQGWVPVQQGVVVLGAWVTGLRPFSSYQARVVAYNSVKGGNASVEIGIMTLTDGMWSCGLVTYIQYTCIRVLSTCVYAHICASKHMYVHIHVYIFSTLCITYTCFMCICVCTYTCM